MTAVTNFEHAERSARAPRGTPGALAAAVLATLCALAPAAADAGPREQAKRIHDRLNGVPPAPAMLDAMAARVQAGNAVGAALLAIDGDATTPSSGAFYSVVLKNFAKPWTNRDQTAFVPLNDYVATIVGMVRDEVPFNTVLSGDILYVGKSSLGLPAYSVSANDHYEQMESRGVNLKDGLDRATQSSVTGLPAAATAGVMTTRAAARAFFVAGTNRAMFRFTLMNYMCRDLEQVMDTTRPTDRIRQDVSRSPGGDSRQFLGNCAGCHTGMDPMAQAFAYYNYSFTGDESTGQIQYTAGTVQPKYFNNEDTFKPGFRTPDDSWENRWRKGPNQLLGWDASKPGSGVGAKTLGEELGASDAFAQCQVEKVFRNVCLRAPSDVEDRAEVGRIVGVFKSNGYSLKRVFAETAAYCKGD
jgi:hypothetical protein